MVDYAHDKKGKRFDVKWGNMVVRHFSYEKKADMAKTKQQAKDRCRGPPATAAESSFIAP